MITTDTLLTSLSSPLVFSGLVGEDEQWPTEQSSFNCLVTQAEPDPERIGGGRVTGQRNHDLPITTLR